MGVAIAIHPFQVIYKLGKETDSKYILLYNLPVMQPISHAWPDPPDWRNHDQSPRIDSRVVPLEHHQNKTGVRALRRWKICFFFWNFKENTVQ